MTEMLNHTLEELPQILLMVYALLLQEVGVEFDDQLVVLGEGGKSV